MSELTPLIVFFMVVSVAILFLYTLAHLIIRDSEIERVNNIRRELEVRVKVIPKLEDKLEVNINFKFNKNFRLGFFFFNRNIKRIDRRYQRDKKILSYLNSMNNFYGVIESNFKEIEEIRDNLNGNIYKDNNILILRIKRTLESKMDFFDKMDIKEININNLQEVHEYIQLVNYKLIAIKKQFRLYLSSVKEINGHIKRLKSYYPEVSNLKTNKDYIYSRLNNLISEIKGSYFVKKISKKGFDNSLRYLESKMDDFYNIYSINKRVDLFYKNKKKILKGFTDKVTSINLLLLKFAQSELVEKYTDLTPKGIRSGFVHYRTNILKLVNNSYESLKERKFKNANISMIRCGYILKELSDRIRILEDLNKRVNKSKMIYMEYNHDLKSIKGSLFSNLVKRFKDIYDKELSLKFKSVWDSIIYHHENKTDIITLADRSKKLVGELLKIEEELGKRKMINPFNEGKSTRRNVTTGKIFNID